MAAVLGTSTGHYGRRNGVCWLSGDAVWFFVGPALLVIAGNLVVLSQVIRSIVSFDSSPSSKLPSKVQAQRAAKASASFSVLMGITWLPTQLAHIDSTAAHYVFAITGGFSGLWLFLLHCYTDQNLRSHIRKRLGALSSSGSGKSLGTSSGTAGTPGGGRNARGYSGSSAATAGKDRLPGSPADSCFAEDASVAGSVVMAPLQRQALARPVSYVQAQAGARGSYGGAEPLDEPRRLSFGADEWLDTSKGLGNGLGEHSSVFGLHAIVAPHGGVFSASRQVSEEGSEGGGAGARRESATLLLSGMAGHPAARLRQHSGAAAHDQRRPTSGFDISTLRLSGPGRRLTDVGGLASEDDEVSERDTRLTAYSMGGVSLRGLGFLPPAYDLPPVDEQVELCATPSHRRRSSRV